MPLAVSLLSSLRRVAKGRSGHGERKCSLLTPRDDSLRHIGEQHGEACTATTCAVSVLEISREPRPLGSRDLRRAPLTGMTFTHRKSELIMAP